MVLDIRHIKKMVHSGSLSLDENLDEFSRIDSLFGDGDHGATMERISKELKKTVDTDPESLSEMFSDLSRRVMNVNGGSAGPLYGMIFEGFSEALEGVKEVKEEDFKKMFASALESLSSVSQAKEGDKTMMDAFIPACRQARESGQGLPELMDEIARAGREGTERSKEYQAKYGRARFHKEKTIGTTDAGAFSLSCLLTGFAKGLQ